MIANLPKHWSVYEGQGAGTSAEVVRDFALLDGGGERMAPEGNETKANHVPSGSVDFQEAVAAVERAHLGELERLEARLAKQKDEDIKRLRQEYEGRLEALQNQHAAHLATQSAGTGQALRDMQEGQEVFAASAQALGDELDAARVEEIQKLQARLDQMYRENADLREKLARAQTRG